MVWQLKGQEPYLCYASRDRSHRVDQTDHIGRHIGKHLCDNIIQFNSLLKCTIPVGTIGHHMVQCSTACKMEMNNLSIETVVWLMMKVKQFTGYMYAACMYSSQRLIQPLTSYLLYTCMQIGYVSIHGKLHGWNRHAILIACM